MADRIRNLSDARRPHSEPRMQAPLCVGRIVGFDEQDRALVDYPGNPAGPAVARSLPDALPSGHPTEGVPVALAFQNDDPSLPVIVGIVHDALYRPQEVEVTADGRRMVFEAKEEIVLRCGEASITLTRDGRIAIRGNFIDSRSRWTHKVQGGSVQIN